MSSRVKKFGIAAAIAALAALGIFLYATRPLAAPSESSDQPAAAVSEGQRRYRIDPASSKASFSLNEVLSGTPTLVVGETNKVEGEFGFDPQNASTTNVGTVRVNARGFKTDSARRDSAIGRFILKSEEADKEYVVYEITSMTGVPQTVAVDQSFGFKMTGNLTIAGITKETTFEGEASLDKDGKLKGEASSTVNRADYKLVIPSVPFVANVDEQVKLKIEFVAAPIPE